MFHDHKTKCLQFFFRFLHSFQYRTSHSKTHDRILKRKNSIKNLIWLDPNFHKSQWGRRQNSYCEQFTLLIFFCYNYFFFLQKYRKKKKQEESYTIFFFENQQKIEFLIFFPEKLFSNFFAKTFFDKIRKKNLKSPKKCFFPWLFSLIQ